MKAKRKWKEQFSPEKVLSNGDNSLMNFCSFFFFKKNLDYDNSGLNNLDVFMFYFMVPWLDVLRFDFFFFLKVLILECCDL